MPSTTPETTSEDITSSPEEAPSTTPEAEAPKEVDRKPIEEEVIEPVEAAKPESAPTPESIPEIKVNLLCGFVCTLTWSVCLSEVDNLFAVSSVMNVSYNTLRSLLVAPVLKKHSPQRELDNYLIFFKSAISKE